MWKQRAVMIEGVDGKLEPPETLNVEDNCSGFTAVTKFGGWRMPSKAALERISVEDGDVQKCINKHSFNTLWRPISVLNGKKDRHTQAYITGRLVGFNSQSFWQNNNDVTFALYTVYGYQYLVGCWFDNKTGLRIA